MKPKIFLSYSSKDRAQVRKLARDLRAHDINVWLDEWEIRVGDPIPHKIQWGLNDSQFIGVWLTKESVRSGWVEREWQSKYYDEVNTGCVAVLPLLAEDCDVPRLLREKKYADFRNGYEAGLRELLKALLPSTDEAQVESLLVQAKDEFRLGEDSYFNLSRELLQLLRGNGPAGLLASKNILWTFQQEVRQAVKRVVPEALQKQPKSAIPVGTIVAEKLTLSDYHNLSATFGGYILRRMNPFDLPCSYHPLIHLEAALLLIQEKCGTVTLSTDEWNETMDNLFSCLDFWIAYLSETGGASPPQEQFVRDLMATCASVWRSLGKLSHPAFLAEMISKETSLATFTPTDQVVGHTLNEQGLVKIIRPSRQKSGGIPLSDLAKALFSLPDETKNDGLTTKYIVRESQSLWSRLSEED